MCAEIPLYSCTVPIKKVCETRDVVQKTLTREDGVKYGKKLFFNAT